MSAFLEEVLLDACEAELYEYAALDAELDMSVDVEGLAFDTDRDDRVVITAGLSLSLFIAGDEELAASLEATFLLWYRMRSLDDLDEQREFSSRRALRDVWPYWRTWLHDTLSRMGLPPTTLPAEIPHQLLVEGEEAFDLTLEEEAMPDD